MATPSDIVRSVLIDHDLVYLPNTVQTEPLDGKLVCYTESLPDEQDEALLIHDVAGMMFGKLQRGRSAVHPGIKILMRSLDPSGLDVLANILGVLDPLNDFSTVWLGTTHYIQSIYRQGSIVSLGEEIGKKRLLYTVNARVAFQWREPFLG